MSRVAVEPIRSLLRRARHLRWPGGGLLALVLASSVFASSPAGAAPAAGTTRLVGLPITIGAGDHRQVAFAGFALAGDEVVWARSEGRRYDAYVQPSQSAPALLGHVVLPGGVYPNHARVIASSDVAAVQVSYEQGKERTMGWTGRAWAIPGAIDPAAACRLGAGACAACPRSRPLAVSGTAVATAEHVCDLASGTVSALPPGASAVRIAGDVAAVTASTASGSQLIVLDWRSGAELYRITGLDYDVSGGMGFPVEDVIDVQSDGTAVFPIGDQLAWASPAEPMPHPFTTAGAPVRIAQGLVAVQRYQALRGAEVDIVGLDGSRRLLVPAGIGWDFDGGRLAVARRPCSQTLVAIADLEHAAAVSLPRRACPIPRLNARPRLLAGGRLRLGYACPALSILGCLAKVTVWFHARQGRGRSGVRLAASVPLASAPGQRSEADVALTGAALRLVRCERAVTAVVLVRSYPNADAPPPASTPGARARLTVRRDRGGRCRAGQRARHARSASSAPVDQTTVGAPP